MQSQKDRNVKQGATVISLYLLVLLDLTCVCIHTTDKSYKCSETARECGALKRDFLQKWLASASTHTGFKMQASAV